MRIPRFEYRKESTFINCELACKMNFDTKLLVMLLPYSAIVIEGLINGVIQMQSISHQG